MNGRVILGVILILLGLSSVFDFPFIKVLFAAFLIWLGFRVIGGKFPDFNFSKPGSIAHEDYLRRVLIFSGINQKYQSSKFSEAEVVAIFGGGEVDLSEVKTLNDSLQLDFVAIFGGLKIRLPANWDVNAEGVGIIGGFDNHTNPEGKKLIKAKLKGVAIFGGVEIVN